jgi:hypothetical protein
MCEQIEERGRNGGAVAEALEGKHWPFIFLQTPKQKDPIDPWPHFFDQRLKRKKKKKNCWEGSSSSSRRRRVGGGQLRAGFLN